MKRLTHTSAKNLATMIRQGEVSCEAVVREHIDYIKRKNREINAVSLLCESEALLAARAIDTQPKVCEDRPLFGVPILLKDAFRLEGIRTTYGLPQYRNYKPKCDSEVVRRLKDAGAIIIGRSNLPFASFDWQCRNPNYLETTNPWDPTRSPGGSSGGAAAAVASGFVPLDLGSDIAGSIRQPAHSCGIFGLRTTDGLIPNRDWGPEDLPPPFQHLVACGPMGRSVEDLHLMMQALAPESARNVEPLPGTLQIGYSRSLLGLSADSETAKTISDFLRKLQRDGHSIIEGAEPDIDYSECFKLWGHIAGFEYNRILPRFLRVLPGSLLFKLYFLHLRLGDGPLTKHFKSGMSLSEKAYEAALKRRSEILQVVGRYFEKFDLWMLPSAPGPAFQRVRYGRFFRVDGMHQDYTTYNGTFLCPTAIIGTPVLNVPIGFANGLPVGVQIHSRPNSDFWLLKVAEKYFERHADLRWPSGFSPDQD